MRNGTTNLFVAVEPKAGKRVVSVTAHRGKTDFVAFIGELLTGAYAKARRIHLVLDNLNTHHQKVHPGCAVTFYFKRGWTRPRCSLGPPPKRQACT